jgi:uncharacterized membrane protein YdjX (TVP38/TMEM64 family)
VWTALGLRWFLGVLVVGAIDGAFLGGVAAIISAVGTFLLGFLAFRAGQLATQRQLDELRKAPTRRRRPR